MILCQPHPLFFPFWYSGLIFQYETTPVFLFFQRMKNTCAKFGPDLSNIHMLTYIYIYTQILKTQLFISEFAYIFCSHHPSMAHQRFKIILLEEKKVVKIMIRMSHILQTCSFIPSKQNLIYLCPNCMIKNNRDIVLMIQSSCLFINYKLQS